jgi:putative phosphoribosyl transferase
MYFSSRMQAGRMLANQLKPKYRYENCAVVALNNGGVMVGAQIASELHCILMMLLSEEIKLPQEPVPLAAITQDGSFSFNERYQPSEIEEMMMEYHSVVEQEKVVQMDKINKLIGDGGLMRRELLKGHNVILVADGLQNGFMLDLAIAYLKPMAIDSVVVAVPLASVEAVDRMHVLADDIYCLSVVSDYISTDHYYDKNDVPDEATVIKTIGQIILNWK